MAHEIKEDKDIKDLLTSTKTIAVVGLSPNPSRPSYEVASYLQSKGYKIVPVRPEVDEVLGEKAYASLKEIPFPVDMVDIFRKPEHIPAVVTDAVAIGAKSVWMQLGLSHEEAAATAVSSGLSVVQDRCILIEHKRLI